jgi:hypothetical protein
MITRVRKQRVTYLTSDKRRISAEVKTHKGLTKWTLMKRFLDKMKVGDICTRRQLIYAVYTKKCAPGMICRETTVDNYRNACCHTGFLEKVGFGQYKKLHDFPEKLSLTVLRKHSAEYSKRKNWKSWVVPVENRPELIFKEYENK